MDMKTISKKLRGYNISTQISGFEYLKEAILMISNDITYKKKITTRLYPEIAAKFNTAPSSVERAIRYAIVKAGIKKTNAGFISDFIEDMRDW